MSETISTTLIQKFQNLAYRMGVECHDIRELIANGLNALKNEIIGEASAAYDSFKELEDYIKEHNVDLARLQAIANGSILFNDTQNLTDLEKSTARSNIGAGSATDVSSALSDISSLQTRVGNAESVLISNRSSIDQNIQNITSLTSRIDILENADLDTRLTSIEGTIERSDLNALADFMDSATETDFVSIFDNALENGATQNNNSQEENNGQNENDNEDENENQEVTIEGGGEGMQEDDVDDDV